MSDGVTRLRINTDSGEATFGSGQPGAPKPEGEYTPESFHGVKPYSSMVEFIADTQTAAYKGNPLDPRAGEAYRRNSELRLAAMEHAAAVRAAHSAPTDLAGQIVAADSSINPALAQVGVKLGPYVSREERQKAYSDPRYSQSQDYRDVVASRDAITEW